MFKRKTNTLSALLLLAMASLPLLGISQEKINLRNMDGEPSSLQQVLVKGQWTLVDIWQIECATCLTETPKVLELDRKRDDITVVGINVDGFKRRSAIKKHLRKKKYSSKKYFFNNYVAEQDIFEIFPRVVGKNLRGTPTFLLYSPEGELMAVNPGRISVENVIAFINKQS